MTPQRIEAAQAALKEIEQLKRQGLVPIVSQASMATILALVQDKRVSCAAALVVIEQWADDFCRRNMAAHLEIQKQNAERTITTDDGPRVESFPKAE